jgi:molybdopterin converting factor small subunit
MEASMITVRIEVRSWISASFGKPESGHHLIRKKIKTGAVLSNLFKLLGEAYPEFRQQVYNPDGGHLSEQVMVTVNHNLVQESEFAHTFLRDNDEIALFPILVGG